MRYPFYLLMGGRFSSFYLVTVLTAAASLLLCVPVLGKVHSQGLALQLEKRGCVVRIPDEFAFMLSCAQPTLHDPVTVRLAGWDSLIIADSPCPAR